MWTPTKIAVLLTFFVVGFLFFGAHAQVNIPAGTEVRVVKSKTCRDSVYYASTNVLYVYDCSKESATDRVVNRSISRATGQIERSIQHGIDRQIYEMGRKIDKALGRF